MPGRFLTAATGLVQGDHVCWPFHGADEFAATAREYVAEGLARHELVTFVQLDAEGLQHAVVSDVAQVGRPAGARRPVLSPLTAAPGWTVTTDPAGQLAAMTDAALAGGFSGLRLIADVTEQARTADDRDPWVRAEHLIDRFALDHPLTALCGYDVDDIGEAAVAEVACVHALTRGAPSPFVLRAAGGDRLALSGEVDVLCARDLNRAMVRIAPRRDGPVVVDVSGLDFVDHAGLIALDEAGRSLGTEVRLEHPARITVRLVGALGLLHVTAGTPR